MTVSAPAALGRGIVVGSGAGDPAGFAGVPRVRVDDEVLADPAAGGVVDALQEAWCRRRPVVVELAVPAEDLKAPEVCGAEPWTLDPGFTFERERLHFLVWANTYDGRTNPDEPVWWHGVRAGRLGATVAGLADVVLPDGTPAWCDGGPRQPVAVGAGETVVHRDSIDAGLLTPARWAAPTVALAPDQLAAVTHPGGPARIIAPAGSGKTRVLTERIRHLISDRGYEPELVTAVAYNVLAAGEMRERTAGFAPTIRTLNSLALYVCQQAGAANVVEERDQRRLLDDVLASAGVRRGGGRRQVGTDPLAPYLDALSTIRLGLLSPDAAETLHPDAYGMTQVFPAYREALSRRGLVDFDEQIYRAVELLLSDHGLRARVRAGARTLLVDEFQDLTPAHLLLVRLVAGPAADVFGVGDDDQVIYGYSGADPGFLIDYPRYFPGAAAYDLTVNYRCPPAIVGAAATLLTHNRRRLPKTINHAPGREADTAALAVQRVPATGAAPAALDRVKGWLGEGVAPSDIAVLTRVNSSLLPVQVLLAEAGVPYTAAVGPWLLERPGTAAALAYLRMGAQPGRIASADVRATVRRPSRGISPKAIDILTKEVTTSLRSISGLADWMGDKDTFLKDAEKIAGYAADLTAVSETLSGGASTAEALARIRSEIGLGQALSTLDASKGTLDRSAAGDDLAALEAVAALHADPTTFEAWLRERLAEAADRAPRPGVHLATVHRVKGREWPHVVVLGADDGLLPHRLADDVEEERRIFHVAVTRARTSAVVVADATSPSPFLDELDSPPPPADERRRLDDLAARLGRMAPPKSERRSGGKAPVVVPTADDAHAPVVGDDLAFAAGRSARVIEIRRGEIVVLEGERKRAVDLGTEIRREGGRARLVAPPERVAANTAALTAWRTAKAKAEGKPAYVFLSNAHLAGIAERDPDTLARLARCAGIGPTRLDAYGEEILAALAAGESSGP
jgi:DNA helicase-2/ATP-dependent DNA helicase PcrA